MLKQVLKRNINSLDNIIIQILVKIMFLHFKVKIYRKPKVMEIRFGSQKKVNLCYHCYFIISYHIKLITNKNVALIKNNFLD